MPRVKNYCNDNRGRVAGNANPPKTLIYHRAVEPWPEYNIRVGSICFVEPRECKQGELVCLYHDGGKFINKLLYKDAEKNIAVVGSDDEIQFFQKGRYVLEGAVWDIREKLIYAVPQPILREFDRPNIITWNCNEVGTPSLGPAWFKATGQNEHEAACEGWRSMLHPDDRERVFRTRQAAINDGVPYTVNALLRMATGKYSHVIAAAIPVFAMDGLIESWQGMCRIL